MKLEKVRLYYIDWLRVLVILSLIPYHSALTYTGLGDIYIKTPINDIEVMPFLIFTAPLGSFFMTLLFFVSGIATYYSFQNRGSRKFKRERVRKLLVPFVLGTLFICPVQAYFKGLYNGFSGNIIGFLPEFFSTKIVNYLGYAHLWFLLYLFVFSLICIPLFKKWQGHGEKLNQLSIFLCKGNNIYLPILFIIFAEMLLRPFFSGMQTFIMDWANDVVYISIFIFGFVFASDQKIQQRVSKLKNVSCLVFTLLSIFYVMISYLWLVDGTDLWVFWAITKGAYECSAIIFLLWLGEKCFNRKSKALSYLNKASFTYYLLHFIPVSMFTYYFTKINSSAYIKYFLVVILSYLFIFTFYEIFVRRIFKNCTREIFY